MDSKTQDDVDPDPDPMTSTRSFASEHDQAADAAAAAANTASPDSASGLYYDPVTAAAGGGQQRHADHLSSTVFGDSVFAHGDGDNSNNSQSTGHHNDQSAHVATADTFPSSVAHLDLAVAQPRKEKGQVRFNKSVIRLKSLRDAAGHGDGDDDDNDKDGRDDGKDDTSVPAKLPGHRQQMARPSILRGNSAGSVATALDFSDGEDLYYHSGGDDQEGIPLRNMMGYNGQGYIGIGSEQTLLKEEHEGGQGKESEDGGLKEEAANLVRAHTHRFGPGAGMSGQASAPAVTSTTSPPFTSGLPATDNRDNSNDDDNGKGKGKGNQQAAPTDLPPSESTDGFRIYDGVYDVPAPQEYRGSVLSQLLKLYKPTGGDLGGQGHQHQHQHQHQHSGFGHGHGHGRGSSWGGQSTTGTTPGSGSGSTTPRRKWYEQNRSQETLANLISASAKLANPNAGNGDKNKQGDSPGQGSKKRPPMHKRVGSGAAARLSSLFLQQQQQQREAEEARITVHIAETLSRQAYIIKLCRALMLFGAPTHRLEEYLAMTARVLEIDGQFLYLPGCMVVSFDDRSTHTTEVRIVRTAQGIDLGKLKDVHHVYKEVMHDVVGVEEGSRRLEDLIASRVKFAPWWRVLVFGLTSAAAAPFSFKARPIDLPLCFVFGCLVGLLQLIVAPKSTMYNNVFEVSATVLVSFLARAFGSLRDGKLFCFSALAQGGIVMLLPGYSVLCSALELQSRAIVPGSIRIVYAIIYSLFLGFGITVGAALWGLFDSNATSSATCENPLDPHYGFIFVPPFVVCIAVLYQAKWQQMPVMVIIAFTGYVVNYFSGLRFSASPQIASTLGALSVGVLANLYSRVRHGVAAATLIPAIFTQVPGGLASTGGLLSGLSTANMLTNASRPVNDTGSALSIHQGESLNNVVFQVAASMIQIAIGIAVGLFMSALIIYPLGKRRSGLFSF